MGTHGKTQGQRDNPAAERAAVKQVEARLTKAYPSTFFLLDGATPKNAAALEKEMGSLAAEFPAVMRTLDHVVTRQSGVGAAIRRAFDANSEEAWDGGTYTYTDGHSSIVLGENAVDASAQRVFDEALKGTPSLGAQRGTNVTAYILRHEFGHVLQAVAEESTNPEVLARYQEVMQTLTYVQRNPSKYGGEYKGKYGPIVPGTYSVESPDELFAELFAARRYGEPRRVFYYDYSGMNTLIDQLRRG